MKSQSVLLIGEHTLLRAFLRAWLSRFKQLQVVAESENAKQTLELVAKHKSALVLIDFDTLKSASLEVLLIALGLSTKAIAFELKINGKTVDLHKQTLIKRLGLKMTSKLFKYPIAAGVLSMYALRLPRQIP